MGIIRQLSSPPQTLMNTAPVTTTNAVGSASAAPTSVAAQKRANGIGHTHSHQGHNHLNNGQREYHTIMDELHSANISPYDRALYNTMIGQWCLNGEEYENYDFIPTINDVRTYLTANYILPLGNPLIKEQLINYPQPIVPVGAAGGAAGTTTTAAPTTTSTAVAANHTLLLYGHCGVGKTTIAKAITADSGSIYFDVSYYNIHNKLGTKLEIIKLVHLIMNVAKILQPSVIHFGNIDTLFTMGSSNTTYG